MQSMIDLDIYVNIHFTLKYLQIDMSSNNAVQRPRTAWFPVIASVANGSMQIQLGWRFVDGAVGFFSSAAKNKRDKHSWGEVINCSLKVTNIIDEPEGRFLFENRGRLD